MFQTSINPKAFAKVAGVILYEGPSKLDGKPIAVIASGLAKASRNTKTGAMVQTYIIRTRSEEHTSELQSLMRISYAVFCLKKKTTYLSHLDHYKNNENVTKKKAQH